MDSEILESNTPAREGLKLSNFSEEQFFAQLRYQATEEFALGASDARDEPARVEGGMTYNVLSMDSFGFGLPCA